MVGGITDEASPPVSSLMVMIARSWEGQSGESSRKRTVAICIQTAVHSESQEPGGEDGEADRRSREINPLALGGSGGDTRKGEARNLALQFDFR